MAFETYATPKNIVAYPEYPQYKTRTCGNCRHWAKIDGEEKGYCINPDIPAFVEGGITEPVKAEFGCLPLWEEREQSEGE